MLFEKEKRRDGVWAQTDEAGDPAAKGPGEAFAAVDAGEEGNEAGRLGVGGAHEAGLDDVDGAADRRGDEAGQEGGGEVGGEVVWLEEGRVRDQRAFEAVVRGQLRGCHEQRAEAVGPDAAEERADAFFARHADKPVNGVSVVASFREWEGGVVLHAHVEHVGRIACYAAEEARCRGDGHKGRE